MDARLLGGVGLLLPIVAIALYRTADPPDLNPTKADKTEAGEGEEGEEGGWGWLARLPASSPEKNTELARSLGLPASSPEKNTELARSLGTAKKANNLKEVRADDLIEGKDYYIEMVGRYKNEYRQSGKAIGIAFTKIITFKEIKEDFKKIEKELGDNKFSKFDCGIGLDNFDSNDKFVVFEKVIPVNPGERECGICEYGFYPPLPDDWDTMTVEEKTVSRGGYKFFEKESTRIIQQVQMRNLMKTHPEKFDDLPDDVIEGEVSQYVGGKKRKKVKSKKVKSEKVKRKKKNKTEKNKTKKK